MPKVTILGAGIAGLTIASQLPRDYDVTVVGKHLPWDDMTPEYTSQWAGAIWLGVHDSNPRDQQLMLDALPVLWRIAETNPESSVRQIELTEIMNHGDPSKVWYHDKVDGFRWLSKEELPEGAKFGMRWKTVVMIPPVFLAWLGSRLKERGVQFKRMEVRSLGDLSGMGHDVLVNATGFGAVKLIDVQDKKIKAVKQPNIRIRKEGYNALYIRRGENNYYSTAFSRGDGTIYIGGVKTEDDHSYTVNEEHRAIIMHNAHLNNPTLFPSPSVEDYDFITDHVGVFPIIPSAKGGVRCEKEIVRKQKVVHVYGQESGGFTYSFGLAREAARLVTDFMLGLPVQSKL